MVKDSISGEPLPFVSVYFEGTTIGMLTDENGRFTLQHKGKHLKLSASSLEYNPKTISLKAGRTGIAAPTCRVPTIRSRGETKEGKIPSQK